MLMSLTMMTIAGVTFARLRSRCAILLTLIIGTMMIPNGATIPVDYDDGEGWTGHEPQRIFRDNKEYDRITRSAKDSVATLGCMWDDVMGRVQHGRIFRKILPKECKDSVEVPYTTYVVNTKNSQEEQLQNHFVGTEQECSMFGALGTGLGISYSSSDSSESHKSKNREAYTFSGISRSRYEFFDENDECLTNVYDYNRLVTNTKASHIIIGITYGFKFDLSISLADASAGSTNGSERMFALKAAASDLEYRGELKDSTSKSIKRVTANFDVEFDGNLAAPVFGDGASPWEIITALPIAMKNAEEKGKYIALEFTLLPINAFFKFLSQRYLNELSAMGRIVSPLGPLQKCESKTFRAFMRSFNERKRSVSEMCDTIQMNIRKFAKKIRVDPLVARCEEVRAGEPKIRAELLEVLKDVRNDKSDNCERVAGLYNYTDTHYVSAEELTANSHVSSRIQRFIGRLNAMMGAGVGVADGKTTIVGDMVATRSTSYVMHFNSSQILNSEEGSQYITDFERNAGKIVALKEAHPNDQFIITDCAESYDACPRYGRFDYTDLHISKYKYTALDIEDLLYFWANRNDYCGIKKSCRYGTHRYGKHPCIPIPVYPDCIRPPRHIGLQTILP